MRVSPEESLPCNHPKQNAAETGSAAARPKRVLVVAYSQTG